ncbi:MAG: NAD(P)/FAD-dependent oxidoreductase [Bacteroidota bacterium]
MERFDVIIVGGGPAGLQCARELADSDLRVLLLEKGEIFGDKLCAGGLTLKDMEVLELPDSVVEHRISRATIHSRQRRADTNVAAPFLFTVDRRELGAYQRGQLEGTGVEVRTKSQVTEIASDRVILKEGEAIGYTHLVGADGYASRVRRHLGLEVGKRLIGFQYTIPVKRVEPVLEMFLDARRFDLWYAWIFPHREQIAVGCCCDPDRVNHLKVKASFLEWVEEMGIDPGDAILESYPIAYDYQGFHFGNIFLAGEAAGLASGFTGEGVYQSLVSGQEVARMILDPAYNPELLKSVLKYNRTLEKVMKIFRFAGPLKGVLQELLVFLMTRRRIRNRINAGFS